MKWILLALALVFLVMFGVFGGVGGVTVVFIVLAAGLAVFFLRQARQP